MVNRLRQFCPRYSYIRSDYDVQKNLDDFILNSFPKEGPVEIGDGAFIGWNSIILTDVKISKKAIVTVSYRGKRSANQHFLGSGVDPCERIEPHNQNR